MYIYKKENMDLQTRKLKAIEYLIGLQDEKILSKIELAIVEVKKQKTVQQNLEPLSVEELIDRANISTRDYLSGKFKTQKQLEKEARNW